MYTGKEMTSHGLFAFLWLLYFYNQLKQVPGGASSENIKLFSNDLIIPSIPTYFNHLLFQANISLEEYSLMYGVYQKSVRQTEAITNLQKLVQISDSTNSHDFAHTVSPKSKYIQYTPFFEKIDMMDTSKFSIAK